MFCRKKHVSLALNNPLPTSLWINSHHPANLHIAHAIELSVRQRGEGLGNSEFLHFSHRLFTIRPIDLVVLLDADGWK